MSRRLRGQSQGALPGSSTLDKGGGSQPTDSLTGSGDKYTEGIFDKFSQHVKDNSQTPEDSNNSTLLTKASGNQPRDDVIPQDCALRFAYTFQGRLPGGSRGRASKAFRGDTRNAYSSFNTNAACRGGTNAAGRGGKANRRNATRKSNKPASKTFQNIRENQTAEWQQSGRNRDGGTDLKCGSYASNVTPRDVGTDRVSISRPFNEQSQDVLRGSGPLGGVRNSNQTCQMTRGDIRYSEGRFSDLNRNIRNETSGETMYNMVGQEIQRGHPQDKFTAQDCTLPRSAPSVKGAKDMTRHSFSHAKEGNPNLNFQNKGCLNQRISKPFPGDPRNTRSSFSATSTSQTGKYVDERQNYQDLTGRQAVRADVWQEGDYTSSGPSRDVITSSQHEVDSNRGSYWSDVRLPEGRDGRIMTPGGQENQQAGTSVGRGRPMVGRSGDALLESTTMTHFGPRTGDRYPKENLSFSGDIRNENQTCIDLTDSNKREKSSRTEPPADVLGDSTAEPFKLLDVMIKRCLGLPNYSVTGHNVRSEVRIGDPEQQISKPFTEDTTGNDSSFSAKPSQQHSKTFWERNTIVEDNWRSVTKTFHDLSARQTTQSHGWDERDSVNRDISHEGHPYRGSHSNDFKSTQVQGDKIIPSVGHHAEACRPVIRHMDARANRTSASIEHSQKTALASNPPHTIGKPHGTTHITGADGVFPEPSTNEQHLNVTKPRGADNSGQTQDRLHNVIAQIKTRLFRHFDERGTPGNTLPGEADVVIKLLDEIQQSSDLNEVNKKQESGQQNRSIDVPHQVQNYPESTERQPGHPRGWNENDDITIGVIRDAVRHEMQLGLYDDVRSQSHPRMDRGSDRVSADRSLHDRGTSSNQRSEASRYEKNREYREGPFDDRRERGYRGGSLDNSDHSDNLEETLIHLFSGGTEISHHAGDLHRSARSQRSPSVQSMRRTRSRSPYYPRRSGSFSPRSDRRTRSPSSHYSRRTRSPSVHDFRSDSSRSPRYSRISRSVSPSGGRRSRSYSPPDAWGSRSRSPHYSRRPRSPPVNDSRSERSISLHCSRRSRSVSPLCGRKTRSPAIVDFRRSRSRSPYWYRKSRSCSPMPLKARRTRSPSPQYSRRPISPSLRALRRSWSPFSDDERRQGSSPPPHYAPLFQQNLRRSRSPALHGDRRMMRLSPQYSRRSRTPSKYDGRSSFYDCPRSRSPLARRTSSLSSSYSRKSMSRSPLYRRRSRSPLRHFNRRSRSSSSSDSLSSSSISSRRDSGRSRSPSLRGFRRTRSRSPYFSRRSRSRSPHSGLGKDRRSLSLNREDTSTENDQTDVEKEDPAQDSKKKGLIRKLVWMYMNGTAELSEAAGGRITEKAKVFGAGPLFNQILPLLKSPAIQDKQLRLLFELADKILCELGDLIRPSIKKILMGIEPLLIHENTYAREESKKLTSKLAKISSISKKRMRIVKAKKQLELLKKTNERLEEEMKAASKPGQTGQNRVEKGRTTPVSANQAIKRKSEHVRVTSSSSDTAIKRRSELVGEASDSPAKLRKTQSEQAGKATRPSDQNLKPRTVQDHAVGKSTERSKQREIEPGKAAQNSPNPEKKLQKESAKAAIMSRAPVKQLGNEQVGAAVKSANRAKKPGRNTVRASSKSPERANQRTETAAVTARKSIDRVNERKKDSGRASCKSPNRGKERKGQPDSAPSKPPGRARQRKGEPGRAGSKSPDQTSQRRGEPGRASNVLPARSYQRRGDPIGAKSPDRARQHTRQSERSASRSPGRTSQYRRDLRAGSRSPGRTSQYRRDLRAGSRSPGRTSQYRRDLRAGSRSPGRTSQYRRDLRAGSRSPGRTSQYRRDLRRAARGSPGRAGQQRIRRTASRSPGRAGQQRRSLRRTASRSPDQAGRRRSLRRTSSRSPVRAGLRRREMRRAASRTPDRTRQPRDLRRTVSRSPDRAGQRRREMGRATSRSSDLASQRERESARARSKSRDRASQPRRQEPVKERSTLNSTDKASKRRSDTKTAAATSPGQSSKRRKVDETPAKKTTNTKTDEATATNVPGPANPDASASGDVPSMESLLETQMKALKWLMSKTDEESTALLISGDKVGVSPKPIPVLGNKRPSRFDAAPDIIRTLVAVPGNAPVGVMPIGVSPSKATPAGLTSTIITTPPPDGSTPATAQQLHALQWLLPKTPEQMKTWKWNRKPDSAKTVITDVKLPAGDNKTDVNKEKTLDDEIKETQIKKLLQMYLNGTPTMTKTTCRRITDRAKELGADPLLSQILPLLTSSYIQDDDMRLLFKLTNKLLSQLGDLIKPCVQKILDGIESLLIHKNAIARDESRKIVERLAKFSRDKTKTSPDTCSSRHPNR